MKKYLALMFSLVFVLGFAASAFAIPAEIPANTTAVIGKDTTQITLGGELRFRGEYRDNVTDFNKDAGAADSYYDMRIRLSVDAKINANTSGRIVVESGDRNDRDNITWGDQNNTNAAGGSGATGIYKAGNTKKGDIGIYEAWLLHQGSGLFGVPAFVKVGHMPVKLGWGLFLDHTYFGDDAILFGISPTKDMTFILHTLKFRENLLNSSDDHNAYGLIFSYNFDKNSAIGADVTYVDAQKVAFPTTSTAAINLWNLGVRGNTNIAGFGLKADVEFQFGDVSDFPWAAGAISGSDPKFKGYAFWLGVDYTIKPVKIYVDFASGSGDSSVDNKIKNFINTAGYEQHYTYVYEYRTPGAGGNQYGGLSNTTFLRGGVNFDVVKNVNADLSLYWLRATKSSFGGPETGIAGLTPYRATSSKDIGIEFDWKVDWKLDKNLNYWVEGGYLFAGDYWKTALGPNGPADDAWAIRHGIRLTF